VVRVTVMSGAQVRAGPAWALLGPHDDDFTRAPTESWPRALPAAERRAIRSTRWKS